MRRNSSKVPFSKAARIFAARLMELFKILGTIAIDNTKAKDTLKDTTTEAKKTSSETEKAFQKIGNVAKNVALGIGAAGLAIGGAFIGVVESTREYRKEMGLLEAAYLTAGHSSETAKNTYSGSSLNWYHTS